MAIFLSLIRRCGHLASIGVSSSVLLLAVNEAHAQDRGAAATSQYGEGPSARTHHVEAIVGLALSVRARRETERYCEGGCGPTRADTNPTHPGAASFRLGYRLRPVSFVELGVSGEADLGAGRVFTAPLMAYLVHRTDGGSSLSFGLGGGVSHLRADGEQQTVGVVRAEIGGAIPVAAHWSISVLGQLTASARGFRAREKLLDLADDNPEWIGLSLGPRYSF